MVEQVPDRDLDDVFRLVANDTRIEIIRALWAAHIAEPETLEGPRQNALSFSTLRARVGVDDSGRFNYHLDELRPQFVRKREDGYVLTDAGSRVIGAAVSGVYTDSTPTLDTSVMGACPTDDCAGQLEADYEYGHLEVACTDCARQTVLHAPPIVVETHDVDARPATLQRYTTTEAQRMARGFCTLCNGRVHARLNQAKVAGNMAERDAVPIIHRCQECGNVAHTSATVCLLDHPAVVAFLHDVGVDYRTVALWRPPKGVDRTETLRGREPVRIDVTLTGDAETLHLRMDEAIEVIEATREAASEPSK